MTTVPMRGLGAVRALWQRGVVSVRPVWIVTRREMADTLRDWRIVVPILVLVTAFPFLASFAASRGVAFVNRYEGDLLIERLLPFLILVVGFFPSTFSLVIALETFVGEKERRSLESLLATPLTDFQLYAGKLLSAVIPPVAASFVGMAVYVIMAGVSLDWWPSAELLLIAVTVSTAQSLTMVSAAVVVSSQSTSVRAANLLASFIIIPMAFLLQAEAGLLLFGNYTTLWLIALALLVLSVLLGRLGIQVFSRENLLGRHIDRLDLSTGWITFRRAVWPQAGLRGLFLRELPALFRGMRVELLITVLVVMVGGTLVGHWGSTYFPLPDGLISLGEVTDTGSIAELVEQTGLLPDFSVRAVFFNNVRALTLAAIAGFFSLGILAVLLLLAPVAIIAYVTMQMARIGLNPWLFLAATVIPHAIFELPAAIIATAQAMRMGDILLAPPAEGGGVSGVIREVGHLLKVGVLVVLPLLLLAAWIEVNVTPQLLLRFVATYVGR